MSSTAGRRAWMILLARWLFVLFAIVEQASSPWHVFQRDSCVDMDWLSHWHQPTPADGQAYAGSQDEEVPLLGTASTTVGRAAIAQPDHGSYEIALAPANPQVAKAASPREAIAMRWGAGGPRAPPDSWRSLPPPPHAPPVQA
ncbi:hypothetical protein GT347_22145 [Xylophilus rhododendri]|uniref:Uncharacterized protein n=1 Tax=Xylophilus rhododendri TaxID=2697032 RepID=A0A857JCH1_9BURK|nr:hypothetical protein [Xylophilus rhododendri]QHJ00439.1 hypothetical protein GT347_22145 [Xylophilus rhododendri]